MSYGARLKESLLLAKKARRELAAALEISVQAVGQWGVAATRDAPQLSVKACLRAHWKACFNAFHRLTTQQPQTEQQT